MLALKRTHWISGPTFYRTRTHKTWHKNMVALYNRMQELKVWNWSLIWFDLKCWLKSNPVFGLELIHDFPKAFQSISLLIFTWHFLREFFKLIILILEGIYQSTDWYQFLDISVTSNIRSLTFKQHQISVPWHLCDNKYQILDI